MIKGGKQNNGYMFGKCIPENALNIMKAGINDMARKRNDYGKMSIKELATLGNTFPVKYAGFKKVTGTRGSFMSAYFLVQTGENDNELVWVNTPRESSAFKAIGAMTSEINGNPVNVVGLEITCNNNYYDFKYELTERVFDEMPNETDGGWMELDTK